MHLLVLGVFGLVGLVLIVYWLLRAQPATVRRVFKWLLPGLAIAAVLTVVAVRGSPHFLWGALALLVPLFLRARAVARHLRNAARTAAGPAPGQTSSVRTEFLSMSLNHDSGVMEGEVISGRASGQRLQDMSLEALLDLYSECAGDPSSRDLLRSYLDRVHGDAWREAAGEDSDTGDESAPAAAGPMSRAEALEILGLRHGARDEDIREAHRRLMKANHPDRGGSTFLAAQINRAKEVLLGTA